MAINFSITTSLGIVVTYHRILNYRSIVNDARVIFLLGRYVNKAAREADPNAVIRSWQGRASFVDLQVDTTTKSVTLEQLYEYIMALPEWAGSVEEATVTPGPSAASLVQKSKPDSFVGRILKKLGGK